MKIYLSGGFHGDWQARVKRAAPQHKYYNPEADTDQRYNFRIATQDLVGVDWCGLLFAYFDKDNPSGLGLSLEIGYAVARGKRIIYIDEHDRVNGFLAACSERIYTKLEPAIQYLKDRIPK